MAKQVLGRNLGALLKDRERDTVKAETATPASSGVRTLMRGHQSSPAQVLPATATPRPAALPRWYLLGGDVVLTALAVGIVCKSPHPLALRNEVFCAAAILVGAGLAVAALCLTDER